MRTLPLPADFIHLRVCKPFCEKYLTLPAISIYGNPVCLMQDNLFIVQLVRLLAKIGESELRISV